MTAEKSIQSTKIGLIRLILLQTKQLWDDGCIFGITGDFGTIPRLLVGHLLSIMQSKARRSLKAIRSKFRTNNLSHRTTPGKPKRFRS
jgi:hypothetical protein